MSLTERFINGLKNYNLTKEEIKDWTFAGDDNKGFSYFKTLFPDKDLPEHKEKCVCSVNIKRNSFITNGTDLLVLGACCVKKFTLTGTKRTCRLCKEPHKNRSNNLCNGCRVKFNSCDVCDKIIKQPYKSCYKCFKNKD